MILRRKTLPVGLLVLLSCQLVQAEDEDDNGLSILNNALGQTPCELAQDILQCSESRRARAVISRYWTDRSESILSRANEPGASKCTCTNVFFNLWSACTLSENEGAKPASHWIDKCANANLDVHTASFDGYSIPSWAYTGLPNGNATFNIDAAIRVMDAEDNKWSKFQIITVIAVVCSVVGLFAILLLLYRWKRLWIQQHGIANSKRSIRLPRIPTFPLFSRMSRKTVRADVGSRNWEIDQTEEQLQDGYEFVGSANSSRSRSGHIRLPSSPLPYPSRQSVGTTFFSDAASTLRRVYRSIPVPWRHRPVAVRTIKPDIVFSIDEPNTDSRSESTLAAYRNAGHTSYAPVIQQAPRGRSEPTIEEDLGSDSESDSIVNHAMDDERGRLISSVYPSHEPGDDVLLISRSGQDFTVESGDTRSTHSRSTSHHDLPSTCAVPHIVSPKPIPLPRPPPAPRGSPPKPPVVPSHQRSFSRLQLKQSAENMLGLTGVPRSTSESTSTIRAAAPTPSSSSNLPIEPSPLYVRQQSNETMRERDPEPQYQRSPYLSERVSSYSSADLEIPSVSSPPYHPSPLSDERTLSPLPPNRHVHPFSSPQPPHRPLPTPQINGRDLHPRNSSESVVDASMFYSGAVRAAGYTRSRSPSRG